MGQGKVSLHALTLGGGKSASCFGRFIPEQIVLRPPVATAYEAALVLEPVWTRWEREKVLTLAGNQTTSRPIRSPGPIVS